MKVTFLNRKYNPNERSIERLFGFLAQAFQAKDVQLSSIENPYNSGLLNLLKSMFFFRKNVQEADLVHITGQIHFAAIALKTQKIVITVHDLGLNRKLSKIRFFIFKLFYVYLPFFKAQKIIAISEKTKQEIINLMPSIASKVVVIPNCITLNINEECHLKNNSITEVLIIGTRFNKNIENSIKSLVNLPIHLTIIGKLEDWHKELLLQNNISYSNFVNIDENQLVSIYQKTDILLFASVYEGFGLPILEAQAQNVVVVTSDISPMKEVGGEAAILVNPFSVEAIRRGVETALTLSENHKMEFIKKGKNNIQKYTVDNVSDAYLGIYNTLA